MASNVIREEILPSPEERRRILEHARQVLREARAVLDLLDQVQGKLPTSLSPLPAGELNARALPAMPRYDFSNQNRIAGHFRQESPARR